MSISYAILLDGGFVRRKLGTANSPVDATGIAAFTKAVAAYPCIAGMRLHRIYFYDAKPLEGHATAPLGGEGIDFGSSDIAARNKRIQSALLREPFFALRFGELVHEGWQLKPKVLNKAVAPVTVHSTDFQPTIRQKGVDMRIGLDIANLTLKRQVQVIVLVTADSDFIPAMKFARREGAQLFLVTLGYGIKDGMREHADLVIETSPDLQVFDVERRKCGFARAPGGANATPPA
jgi:uncharacterized LabA/DUF88 family protein